MYVDDNLVLMDNQALSGTSVVSAKTYDYGSASNIGSFDVNLTVHGDGQVAGPTDVKLVVEGSIDGTTWSELASFTYTAAEINQGIKSMRIPLRKNRHIRVKVESGDGTTAFSGGKVFVKLGALGTPVRDIY